MPARDLSEFDVPRFSKPRHLSLAIRHPPDRAALFRLSTGMELGSIMSVWLVETELVEAGGAGMLMGFKADEFVADALVFASNSANTS